jgi:signal transduction histidine kinase
LVNRFAGHGPTVQLRLPDDGQGSWPPEVVATTVYRVVQEALTNVVLHAPEAAQVFVTVESGPSGVTVEVVDDAPAGRAAPSCFGRGGYGLAGMRERVEALGGRLNAGSGPAGGWLVRAEVPASAGNAR